MSMENGQCIAANGRKVPEPGGILTMSLRFFKVCVLLFCQWKMVGPFGKTFIYWVSCRDREDMVF